MKKRSAFFAVALAAVLAVGTPATAVQEVVVGVRIVKSNINCALVPPLDGKPVKVGTAEFRAEFRAALEFTAIVPGTGLWCRTGHGDPTVAHRRTDTRCERRAAFGPPALCSERPGLPLNPSTLPPARATDNPANPEQIFTNPPCNLRPSEGILSR